jgi:hypothetical protein
MSDDSLSMGNAPRRGQVLGNLQATTQHVIKREPGRPRTFKKQLSCKVSEETLIKFQNACRLAKQQDPDVQQGDVVATLLNMLSGGAPFVVAPSSKPDPVDAADGRTEARTVWLAPALWKCLDTAMAVNNMTLSAAIQRMVLQAAELKQTRNELVQAQARIAELEDQVAARV